MIYRYSYNKTYEKGRATYLPTKWAMQYI